MTKPIYGGLQIHEQSARVQRTIRTTKASALAQSKGKSQAEGETSDRVVLAPATQKGAPTYWTLAAAIGERWSASNNPSAVAHRRLRELQQSHEIVAFAEPLGTSSGPLNEVDIAEQFVKIDILLEETGPLADLLPKNYLDELLALRIEDFGDDLGPKQLTVRVQRAQDADLWAEVAKESTVPAFLLQAAKALAFYGDVKGTDAALERREELLRKVGQDISVMEDRAIYRLADRSHRIRTEPSSISEI